MRKEINCINFKGLFTFIKKYYGDWGVSTIIHGLVENGAYLVQDIEDPSRITPIRLEHIINANYWVSNEFSIRLLANVHKVIKSENALFEAGRGAVQENLSKSALFTGKLFGPVFLANQVPRINSRFNRTKRVILKSITRREILFQLYYFPGFRVTRDVCGWNLGIYTEFLKSSGVEDIQSEEVKCVVRGDDCCEFRLSWKRSNLVNRLLKGFSRYSVRAELADIIRDYENSLKERDQLIENLINSEAKYKSLFECTATANAILEGDFTISLVNTEFEKMTGYSKQTIESKYGLKDIVDPSDYPSIENHLAADQDTLPIKNSEFKVIDRNGMRKPVLCKTGKIPNSTKSILSMMDITDIKKSEKEKEYLKNQLVRAEKMKALGLLAGGVAHDLNNVLSGIVGYPELLLLDIPEDSHLRKPIMVIKESGVKAAAIVQDMLTLARRDVAVEEVVNLNDILNDYLTSTEYAKMLSFHPNVKVETDFDKELLNITGSPFNLSKAVMNLVTNAAEATKEGGHIWIATKNSYLEKPIRGYDAYREGDYVVLSVSDDGVGIPKQDIERIFEPFYSKKVMGRSGTGLGMTVIWGTVNDHKGHIDVVSEVGKGTTFTIYLPATRKKKNEKKDAVKSLNDLKGDGETILVVDDVKEQRDLASAILTTLNYRVSLACSGEEAVEMVRKEGRFDIVLLDMIMYPGIDGLETFRQINEIYPGQKTIVVSGFSETDRVKTARKLGLRAYVRKPYLIENLAQVIKKELSH